MLTREEIYKLLTEVKDPELPFISIEELGILRDVVVEQDSVRVKITPTYSGCPAMKMIEDEVKACLKKHGIENASVESVLSPPWTTDWIEEEAKEKFRKHGYSPPGEGAPHLVQLPLSKQNICCPFCGSANTEVTSEFGSTACKSLHRCKDCRSPFDHFKAF